MTRMCSALLCFANYWCLWAWVFVCVSLRLCFVFVSAKMIISGKSELLYSAGLFFFVCWRCCCFGCLAWEDISDWWKFTCADPKVEMEQCLVQLCLLLVCLPLRCYVCVDSWKWFICLVWIACLLLHVLCDVVVSRFCVDGDGLCMPCQKLRWNSAD